MSKPFLGVGWSLPMGTDNGGELRLAEYEDSVRQSIWLILGTSKGERVMRPDYGCGLYDFVFEVNSTSTAGRISREITDALLFLEPRIDVVNVEVEPEGEALMISIDYQVRATNNMFNLVYPFYLERTSR